MESIRRLPVYLLLDTSESMAGPAIEAVTQGVNTLVTELRTNPLALETAYLGVITFSRDAAQIVPLTELLRFQLPTLRIRPGTALGAGLRLLSEAMQRDVIKTTAETKGDYKPLVFLLTDGQPTDDWETEAARIKQARIANIYAIGCGPDVDTEVLYRITDKVLVMPNLTPDAIRKFFIWLSASIQTVSTKADASAQTDSLNLPPPPLDVIEEASRTNIRRDGSPRQVFLHALCGKVRQPYLMRFARRTYENLYDAVASHRLESFEPGDEQTMPVISASLLSGIPECPHCDNTSAAFCPSCHVIFCKSREQQTEIVCPKCDAVLVRTEDDGTDFEITGSIG